MKAIAFDCFGTVFDMSGVPRDEIKAYVAHVRSQNFEPYDFPESWWELRALPDSADGIRRLQRAGLICVALSNGCRALIENISYDSGIFWDHIVDLVAHRVYKPHVDSYLTIQKDLGIAPADTLIVTANPTFGDVEGAAAVGMSSQVIRQPGCPQTIVELAEMLATN